MANTFSLHGGMQDIPGLCISHRHPQISLSTGDDPPPPTVTVLFSCLLFLIIIKYINIKLLFNTNRKLSVNSQLTVQDLPTCAFLLVL